MDIVTEFLAILVGVVVSVALPVVVQWLKVPAAKRAVNAGDQIKAFLMPYLKPAIAAIIVSIVIMALASADLADWKAAFMLGLGWQAFIKSLLA